MKNRFKTTYKNGLKILKFDDTEIKEYEFYQQEYQLYESSISIDDKTINEIVVCNKLPFGKQGFKYFTGYKDTKKIDLYACIFFPEISIYNRYFDQTKCMYFVIKDEKLFDHYVKIWEKVSNMIKKLQ